MEMDSLMAALLTYWSGQAPETEGGHMSYRSGDRVKLAPELGGGTAVVVDQYRPNIYQIRIGTMFNTLVSVTAIAGRDDIEWKPGDVVVVRFHPSAPPYTFVRGAETWPADLGRKPKTDEQMNKLYAAGKVTPKLQAGGEPFDPSRLPGGDPTLKLAQGGIVSAPGMPRASAFVWHNDGQMP